MWLAAATAVVMFVFPLWVRFPLVDPDEGLHAAIAQEMVERGHWLTPSLLGKPFWDKPILYCWLQAASLRLLGPNEAAVRLPGLMFGLLGAATTGLLAWRLASLPVPGGNGNEDAAGDFGISGFREGGAASSRTRPLNP